MKKYMRSFLTVIVIVAGLTFSYSAFAQPELPPAPPTSGGNGGSNTPMGGAAPIDGGLIILMAAGIGYGAKKVHTNLKSRGENK